METIEKKFAGESRHGRSSAPRHRSVGGMRVSLYNAVEHAAVEALTSFMREFQRPAAERTEKLQRAESMIFLRAVSIIRSYTRSKSRTSASFTR